MVGKWHLGHADQKYWPQNRGFDHFYGNLVGEVDYFTKERGGLIDWQRNGSFLKEEGYFTTLIGDEAVKLIERPGSRKSRSFSTSRRWPPTHPTRCRRSTATVTRRSRMRSGGPTRA